MNCVELKHKIVIKGIISEMINAFHNNKLTENENLLIKMSN